MQQYIKQTLLDFQVNSKANSQTIQQLTIKQHIIAHHILSKTEDCQMMYAIRRMVNVKSSDELYKAFFVANLRKICNEWCRQVKSKPVINLNTLQIYPSAQEASRQIGVIRGGVCNSIHKQERCKGCFYAYLTDNLNIEQRLKELEEIERNKEQSRRNKIAKGHARRIININTKEIFDSVNDACIRYGVTVNAINLAIRTHSVSKGCFWAEYEEDVDYDQLLNQYLNEINGFRDLQRRLDAKGVRCKEVITGLEFENQCIAARYFGYSSFQVGRSIKLDRALPIGHKFVRCLSNNS